MAATRGVMLSLFSRYSSKMYHRAMFSWNMTSYSRYFSKMESGTAPNNLKTKHLAASPSIIKRGITSNNGKTNTFMTDLKKSPPPALWLGLAGAIPFTSLAGLSLITPSYLDTIIHAQCAYGACILTFLGAIHWGYALVQDSELKLDWVTLGYSVTPSLVAWSSLLMKSEHGLITVFIGLLFALSKDLATLPFPSWYHAMRKMLTALASSSVFVTALAFYMH